MDISVDWTWVFSHFGAMWTRFLQHLQLVVIAVVAGFIIALILAVWSHRRPTVYGPITALTGLLYTIPSLAAFALLRPITGLTLLTALIPLTTYTLLILVRSNGHVFAFALSCPHQNAAVKWVPQHNQFECTKHDSHYTADGTHVSGRATRNLDRMPIRKEGNVVHVDTAHVFGSDKDAADWNAATVAV